MTSAAARTGHANEDFTGAVPTAAVLIDRAGRLAWYDLLPPATLGQRWTAR